jgi:hypothetical protein
LRKLVLFIQRAGVILLGFSYAFSATFSGRLRVISLFDAQRRVGDDNVLRVERTLPISERVWFKAEEENLSFYLMGFSEFTVFGKRFYRDREYHLGNADLEIGYIRFKDFGLDLKVGRQFLFSGASLGAQIDGLSVKYQLPANFAIEGFGGILVSPLFKQDLEDFLLGTRLSYRILAKTHLGLSFFQVQKQGKISRENFELDLLITPIPTFLLKGNVTYDTIQVMLKDLSLEAELRPHRDLTFSIDYSKTSPSLFLDKTSIFSVFARDTRDEIGFNTIFYYLRRLFWIRAGYHHTFYYHIIREKEEELEYGGRIEVEVKARHPGKIKREASLKYERLWEPFNGYNLLRGYILLYFIPQIFSSLDLYLYRYDEPLNLVKELYEVVPDHAYYSFYGALSAGYKAKSWTLLGNLKAGFSPFLENEISFMLKFEYNLESDISRKK